MKRHERLPDIFKNVLRKLAPALLLFLMAMVQPAVLTMGAGQGRDYARCIVSCNAMMRQCRAECRSDCRGAFEPGKRSDLRECRRACYGDCKSVRRSCRDNCKGIKPPPSDNQP